MKTQRMFVAMTAVSLALTLAGTVSAASPPRGARDVRPMADHLKNPLAEKQQALRQQALQQVLKGRSRPTGTNQVVRVATGQYAELARTKEDDIWTVLGEFGTQINPTYGGDPGPIHNQIPAPDRHLDNTSIWTSDFSRAYYDDMLFSGKPGAVSMRNYYLEQSTDRYTVHGTVEDWVSVPFNEARYGTDACGDIVCTTVWQYVNDVVDSWATTSGKSAADLDAYLSQFDVWDRYDVDGDGNFNEPDGYIDHFQTVHAGAGEETGGGAQGENAIWSHRWYAFFPGSAAGPDGAGPNELGGIRIGNSHYWIGDYTVEPEDGGVGVFAHEFGHDLGLPDLYDTSGNVGGAENSTGFWTLYSSGSYGSTGRPRDGIGSKPVDMSALEKLFLGWSKYTTVDYRQKATLKLGPAEATTRNWQHIVALLPDKQVDFDLGAPASGSYFWHSGSGNDLDSSMTRSFTLPAGANTFAAKVDYDTEAGFDFFYLKVSADNGATWTTLPTNRSDAGVNGVSGASGGWVDWTASIPSSFGGKSVLVRIEYVTDGGVAKSGVKVDDVTVAGTTDGAETDGTWTLDGGFIRTTGHVTRSFFNAYFAEFRQYRGYDKSLRTGPYNFGFLNDPDRQNWVEHFSYPSGLLIWYYDESFPDNNVGEHCAAGRCGGLFLPVDAHPQLTHWKDGTLMRPRILSRDSAFGLTRIPSLVLHRNGVAARIPAKAAVPLFDDRRRYWRDCDSHGCTGSHPGAYQPGWYSVDPPNTGTRIRVRSIHDGVMVVSVNR